MDFWFLVSQQGAALGCFVVEETGKKLWGRVCALAGNNYCHGDKAHLLYICTLGLDPFHHVEAWDKYLHATVLYSQPFGLISAFVFDDFHFRFQKLISKIRNTRLVIGFFISWVQYCIVLCFLLFKL